MEKSCCFLTVCMNPVLQKTLVFSRVFPGRVNRTAVHRFDASGKGINVTRVLTQLKKDTIHLTHLGGPLGPFFLRLCEQDKLTLRWVESGSPIRFCYTLLTEEETGHRVTELVEEGDPVGPGTEEKLLGVYREVLPQAKTVIISGSKARGYNDTLVPEMVRLARAQGKRIILDIRGKDLEQSMVYGPSIIKPNLFEFAGTFAPEFKSLGELSGDEEGVRDRIASLALDLSARYGAEIILSRGTLPVWYTCGGVFAETPVEKQRTLNSTGSGDAFTAGLAAALDGNLSLPDAIAEGIRCGSLNAGFLKPGIIEETA
ncbi:MAG: PfkB family carbohydrate kinase [Spirochaetaceae bacterium]|nr:PfkB family carbohydrate kinase [Spirochaetaceae bacterium]